MTMLHLGSLPDLDIELIKSKFAFGVKSVRVTKIVRLASLPMDNVSETNPTGGVSSIT